MSTNQIAPTVLGMGLAGGFGYFATKTFLKTKPWHGAVFCATSVLVAKVVDPLFQKAFSGYGKSDANKAMGFFLSTGTGVAVSTILTTGVGYPIKFKTGLILAGSMLAAQILVILSVVAVKRLFPQSSIARELR